MHASPTPPYYPYGAGRGGQPKSNHTPGEWGE